MTESLPILCFAAGGVRFAVAVADVRGLRDDDGLAPAMAACLGLREHLGDHNRIVTLDAAGVRIDALIHGPIAVRTITVDEIVPPSRGVPLAPAVLGFARVDGELVQLLEVERVIAALSSGAS